MTARQFLMALKYRWRIALAVLCATLLAAFALGYLVLPAQYRAAAEILIEEETTDRIDGTVLPAAAQAGRVPTEVDVLRSERVMLQAMRTLALQDDPALRQRWRDRTDGRGDYETWLVEHLRKNTEVRPTRDSRVLYLSHTAEDPQFAARFVNALVKSYLDTSVELRLTRARQYATLFEDRADLLQERLQQAQRKMSEFNQRHGITTGDNRSDVEEARLSEISAQVVALQARAEEARRRQQEASATPDRMEEVMRDPMVASLATALSVGESRAAELSQRLGNQHPQMVELAASNAALRSRLDAAKRRAATAMEGQSTVSGNQLAERTRALEAQRQRVVELKSLRDQGRLLQNEVDAAQRAYDAITQRVNRATLERNDKQAMATPLRQARVPFEPITAALPGVLAAGLAVGLMLALLAAFVAELRDRRIRSAQDLGARVEPSLLVTLRRRRPPGSPSAARPPLFRQPPALASGGSNA